MISRNQIKHLNSLRLNKYRKIHREFIAEGNKLVLDLLDSDLNIRSIFATSKWLESNCSVFGDKSIIVTDITANELKKISNLTTANEVIAVVEIPERETDITSITNEFVIMLDGIRDPGNLGTIIRIADWFGVSSIICSEDSVDVYNPKVVQASMGSIARVKLYYEDLRDFLEKIPSNTKIFGTFMDGENLSEKKLTGKGIIIIGSEANGISEELFPFINERISIPGFSPGKAESLNAAVACGIVCYEFRRKSAVGSGQ